MVDSSGINGAGKNAANRLLSNTNANRGDKAGNVRSIVPNNDVLQVSPEAQQKAAVTATQTGALNAAQPDANTGGTRENRALKKEESERFVRNLSSSILGGDSGALAQGAGLNFDRVASLLAEA